MTRRDTVAAARAALARPYAAENAASLRRKMQKPRDLLGWFLAGVRAEIPERLHTDEPWHDAKRRGDAKDYAPVGGSLIGTPGNADPFRAFLEGDPLEETELARLTDAGTTVAEEAYRFPMRAALKALAGRGPASGEYPFMARALFRIATMDGDWDASCASFGIPEPVRRPYIQLALERLWDRYSDEPPARPIRSGGPVRPGAIYLVGERGPEVIMTTGHELIVPPDQVRGLAPAV